MKRRPAGWSMIEMMVALTVFAIVMAAIFGVLIPMVRAFTKQQVQHEIYMQTEQTLKRLDQTVSGAFGWLEGDTLRMSLVSGSGDTISIYRDSTDSVLYVNRRPALPAGYKTAEFHISYKPMCDSAMFLSPDQWFIIADSDRDGLIKGEEISGVVSLGLKVTITRAGGSYSGSIFPRIPPAVVDIGIEE